MKTIAFENEEIKELINFYEDELKKTEERLNTIKTIIDKLHTSLGEEAADIQLTSTTEQTPAATKYPSATSPSEQTSTSSKPEPNKRGMKPSTKKAREEVNLKKLDWENFFYNLMKKKNDVLAISDFSDAAYEQFNLHAHKKKNVDYKIRTELNKLLDNGKINKDRIPGVKGFAYGLPEHFDKNGKYKPKKTASKSSGSSTKKDTREKEAKSAKAAETAVVEKNDKQPEIGSEIQELSTEVIQKLVEEKDRPLATSELTDLIYEKGDFKPKDKKKIEKKVFELIEKLFNKDKVLKKYIFPDSRIPVYGFPGMFDENDNIKEEYERKVSY